MSLFWDTPDKLQQLVCELVSWQSVSLTEGEEVFPYKLKEKMEAIPYFQENPEHLELGQVNWGRQYLTALYKHADVAETIVLISHFDTVGTEEYGDLEELAYYPEALTAAFKNVPGELYADALADLKSGEYLFGRGIMDMKAGLALHMAMIEKAAAEQWPINLVLITVPDEEVNSAGMRYGTQKLLYLARHYQLEYVLFLNAEPVFPMQPGDENHYVYTGSIGKILPSALFYGRETHVGSPLAGISSSYISTYLTRLMEWNPAFRETDHGESTPLPVTIMQQDLKQGYSAQTPYRTSAYYNVIVMKKDADDVLEQFEAVAREAAANCNQDYLDMCMREGIQPVGEVSVLRFDELVEYATGKFGRDYVKDILTDTVMHPGWDVREKSMHITDVLLINCQELTPAIVLLFAPPFYPPVNSTGDPLVQACVEQITENARSKFGLAITQAHYFNGMSDLSYVNYGDRGDGWIVYENNTPIYGDDYSIPFETMKRLNAPVMNVGPFGKDAHKRSERLHKRNAFDEMPVLLEDMIKTILVKSRS
ncbi:M20/M25/M40 family metallo-hydrolase [Planococcus lenghuensis]|uniref:Amino acid degradation protein n=1 Tax=Planococcus lenghuensis TaxID=2213202 RepID=A0A1Q2L1K7_9BACL|nr:M20/M25/M40 family metallo-hydrolase [Planococcus lenghuensis]AQQ54254.1 amino acid degradation protein [Planococcus lenghuensis]